MTDEHITIDDAERQARYIGALEVVIELRSRVIDTISSGKGSVSVAELDAWLDDIKKRFGANVKGSK